MKYFLLVTFIIWGNLLFAQEKIEEIEQYDIRSYAPQKSGVSDLVFEARIDKLTEILSKNLALGKLVDVYFKISWLSPSQYKIEVFGLPKGFEDIKADLTALIKGKLEFVLPEKFSDKFKGYKFKVEPIADGKLIRAIDVTYKMIAPEVDISFDRAGLLKTIETKAPNSLVKTEFFHSPKSWSNNKLVLDKIIQSSSQGPAKQMTISELEYISVSGIGFPSQISVKSVTEITVPATDKEKEKQIKNEMGTTIHFTNYEVNTGKARRQIN